MAVRSVLHWGPLVALTIIVTLAFSTVYILAYGYREIPFAMRVNAAVWAVLVCIVLYNFFMAMYTGPGAVPQGWVRVWVTRGESKGERCG